MPLRTRLRRAFTRGSQDDSLSKTTSKSSRRDTIHYQPGEKMPPLKYRRPVDPKHKETLEAFNFSKAWRRRSDQSLYSPFGSRMPSRKASRSTIGRRSIGDRRLSSRGGEPVEPVDSVIGGSLAGDSREDLREGSDEEGDITNVGLSRNPTIDPRKPARRSQSLHRSQSVKSDSTRTQRPANKDPFSPEELEQALQRSALDPTKEESDRSNGGTPGAATPGAGVTLRPREGPVITVS
ncbi:hypothetical protein EJ04DRAFT_140998 [Polyplosphaeria fusca]|uniref:Uncharacterized protein n=1 Tax=Polyplosphaeria fusca TaxID=682080 RepID=A0A9P4UWL5_9PLEO|nr:hypothetical protein EJ04DRAFT_140998 [Polyplosphaeria fusca]